MEIFEELSSQLQKGKAKDVTELTKQALGDGISARDVLDKGLVSGMAIIGEKFKKNEVYVPEVLIAARAMNAALEILEPELAKGEQKSSGTVVVGTVKGDLHDIGKNLVCIMLKGAGFKVVDAGVDVSSDKFVEEAQKNEAHIIGLSALLTTTMVNMKEVVEKVKESGLNVKVMIGGAPVTQEYADEIQADGYSADAASAVDTAKSLVAA